MSDWKIKAKSVGEERVHRHASRGPCRTVCGLPCDSVPVAYGSPGRVTCPQCKRED